MGSVVPTALDTHIVELYMSGMAKTARGMRAGCLEGLAWNAPPREKRTSVTHPLEVSEIPVEFLPGGRLGMTIAPGKQDPAGLTGWHERDLNTDLRRLFDAPRGFDPHVWVTLMEGHELTTFRISQLLVRVALRGARVFHYPIRDVSAPPLEEMPLFEALVEELYQSLTAGERVLVHCKGGLGRTGLVVAAVLVRHGLTAAQAITVTRKYRPGAIEAASQEAYVRLYAQGAARRGGVV